ncbi:MAG: EAL domain-containing response regulator [Deltaproteobacteria bacterium]|nr:EAL domain-containing response regulator [Deltaproteobacteria bacterium]
MSTDRQTPSPSAASIAATAEALPGGRGRTPLAVIVDEESSDRHFVSLIMQGSGVDTIEFADGPAFRNMRSGGAPDMIFLNVSLEAHDAIRSIEALSKTGYAGTVQLMSDRGSAVLESIKRTGEQYKLKMLPGLKKPLTISAIQQVILEQKIGNPPPVATRIGLHEALKSNWIEFWYQPTINLRRKQLAGAEAFVRARHPQHGVLAPQSFMPGADEPSLVALSELALVSALKAGLNFAKLGVNLRIAVDIAISALVKLPVGDIVRQHRPNVGDWPGLIIDLTEEQIITEIALADELTKKLAVHNVRLAIDDFGRGYAALTKLKELPFAEMKLDRTFVADCGTDKVNAPICKTVIDLAHNFGALAVGIGVEKASDMMALVSMGCDLGQGLLLGQPMPEERFIALLKQRALVRPAVVVDV